MLNVDGLVTGIDTESIIQGLLQIQQQQIDRMAVRRQTAQQRRSALQSLEAQVLGLRTQAGRLARSQSSPFAARSVAVSREDALIATAEPGAAPGRYDVRVLTLARAHQIAAQGFSSRESEITQGTLTLRSGSRAAATITIDSTNNTLQGLTDAINAAGAGVSATIVQNGSGTTPYRLLLTAQSSGTAHAVTLTNNLAASGGVAVQPVFDLNSPVQAAMNASVALGSGPGAITVESGTNEIEGLIEGVTLNLLSADPSANVTMQVAADGEAARSAVADFVESYNSVLEFIDSQTGYNAETGAAGLLLGDRTVASIQQELQAAVLDVVPGVSNRMNRLTALGVTVQDDGRLGFNASKLNDVLAGRVAGVTEADVSRLFALDGVSSHAGISFLLGSSRTHARPAPYQVDISQAAEQAVLTGGAPLAGSTVIDGTNDALSLTLDGVELSLSLAHGTYTPTQLADLFAAAVTAHPDAGGRKLATGVNGSGALTLTSLRYGSGSALTVGSGSAVGSLGLSAGQTDVGVDVAGRFIVDGTVEAASGRGRVLSGDSENTHTADLQVRVALSQNQIGGGAEANLTLSRGIAARLDAALGSMLDSEGGALAAADDRFEETIDALQSSIDRQQAIFDRQQERLARQFQSLEAAISTLQSTGSLLSAQLSSLQSLRTTSRG